MYNKYDLIYFLKEREAEEKKSDFESSKIKDAFQNALFLFFGFLIVMAFSTVYFLSQNNLDIIKSFLNIFTSKTSMLMISSFMVAIVLHFIKALFHYFSWLSVESKIIKIQSKITRCFSCDYIGKAISDTDLDEISNINPTSFKYWEMLFKEYTEYSVNVHENRHNDLLSKDKNEIDQEKHNMLDAFEEMQNKVKKEV